MNEQGGYIKLYRKSLHSPMWKNMNLWRFWEWCLLKASYCDATAPVGYKVVDLKPGQFVTSRRKAQEETGLSGQTVKTCFTALSTGKDPSINIKTTHTYTIVTILKWEDYQNVKSESNQQATRKTTCQPPSSNPVINNEEEVKETHKAGASEKIIELGRPILGLTCDSLLDSWIRMWPEDWIALALSKCEAKGLRGGDASMYAQGILRRWKSKGGPEQATSNPREKQTVQPERFGLSISQILAQQGRVHAG